MNSFDNSCDILRADAPTHNPQLSALPCDAYHHYYHYQASAQYLFLAETCRALDLFDEALIAFGKAIFQDHLNEEAISGKEETAGGKKRSVRKTLLYNRHPLTDARFCALIGQPENKATALHDQGITAIQAADFTGASDYFNAGLSAHPRHSNSYFARGKCYFARADYKAARADFEEAVRLSHLAHEAYHRFASDEHMARGREFLAASEIDLAIADFSKALDLHRRNRQALTERAKAYRAKGREDLAIEDENHSITAS